MANPGKTIANVQPAPSPAKLGNGRAVTHGATAELVLAPRVAELVEHLTELVPTAQDRDAPAITLLAWQLARIERANAYLDEHGLLVDKRGVPQPVLKVLSTWENSAARLCDQLGLTPTSRARLGLDLTRGGGALDRHIADNYGGEQ